MGSEQSKKDFARAENAGLRKVKTRKGQAKSLAPPAAPDFSKYQSAELRARSLEPLRDGKGKPLAPIIESLGASQCHWPIGDPVKTGFAFCARAIGEAYLCGDKYCADHKALAYTPGTAIDDIDKYIKVNMRRAA